jgi:hypothetical protein
MRLTTVPVILLFLASRVLAWGEIDHRTVSYLAGMYFSPEADSLFNELVKPTKTFDISDGAVWADSQSTTPWSKPWHYIDAKDDPPRKCKVNFNDDCDPKTKCVVAAIANMVSYPTKMELIFRTAAHTFRQTKTIEPP